MLITCLSAVSVVRSLKKLYLIDAKIKWVNDIFIKNKKVCGILTEASVNIENSSFDYIIVGIGINIRPLQSGCDENIKNIATSVCENTDIPVFKNQLIGEITTDILKNL
jgi:BirA family biotin operon repressor/biotin-[acetyl-CoA-carboxylase] ligase